MKRNSCTSAFHRRLSEADIRNRSNRNITTKNLQNLSASKKQKKPPHAVELKKETIRVMGSKLNNFMNENKLIFSSKTCKNFLNKKPSTANIRNRKSIMRVGEENSNDPQ